MNLKTSLMALLAFCGMLCSMSHMPASKTENCQKKQCKLLQHINQTTEQDLVIDQTTLNVVNQINSTTQQDLAIDQDIHRIVEQFDCVTVIDSLPYLIDSPGHYKVACDLVFDPDFAEVAPPNPGAVQAAITITASDVLLDLGGSHIRQAIPANPSDQVPFCIGILVPDPLPNEANTEAVGQESVYIIGNDAVIQDFSMYGVRIFAHISDIVVRDLTIKNIGALASKALRPTVYNQPYLPHDQITPAFGPSFGVAGLAIGESVGYGMGPTFFSDVATNQLNVVNRTKNVRLSNVNCLNNFFIGATITLTTDLTIDNCHFDYNWSDDPGSSVVPVYSAIGPRGLGFADIQSNGVQPNGNSDPNNVNVVMTNSTCNNTEIRGDYTTPLVGIPQSLTPGGNTGFIVLGCGDARSQNVTFDNCSFNSSKCTFPNAVSSNQANFSFVTSRACGYVGGASEDLTFIDCTSDGHFNLGNINGYNVSGSSINEAIKSSRNTRFFRCTTRNLQCRTDLILPAPPLNNRTIQGWNTEYNKDIYFEDCVATDIYQAGPTPTTGSTSSGFAITSNDGPLAAVENYMFQNCKAARVRAADGGVAIGYNVFVPTPSVLRSLFFDGCVSTGNQTMLSGVYTAWSNATTYSVGALVSLSGVNYVSLTNSNLNNPPNTSPSQWSVVNSSPAAWVSTTNYSLGALAGSMPASLRSRRCERVSRRAAGAPCTRRRCRDSA